MHIAMIIRRCRNSIVTPGIVKTMVYFCIVLVKPRLALPVEDGVESLPSDIIAEEKSSDHYSQNMDEEKTRCCDYLNRSPNTGKISAQISLEGDIRDLELTVRIKYTPDQILTINPNIVNERDLASCNEFDDQNLSTQTTPDIDEEKMNEISTTPMTMNLLDKIKGSTRKPGISVAQSTRTEASSQQSTAIARQTTSETSLYTDKPNPKTTRKNSRKQTNKFTNKEEKTTLTIPETTLATTAKTTILEKIKSRTIDSEDFGTAIIDEETTSKTNLEVTSPNAINMTTELDTTNVHDCKIPSISEMDIRKIAEAIKSLYREADLTGKESDLTTKTLGNIKEQVSSTTEKVIRSPTTSMWYNLIQRNWPSESKKQIGLAKINYR